MNTAYLLLGSNIEPEKNMRAAVELLAQETRLVAVSSVWESLPVGRTNQPNFLNAAAIVETNLTATQLKEQVLSAIEQKLGRVRQFDKNAPRPMDIDIMFFNQQIFEVGQRHIPDPEVLERPFVAIPLAEIAPNYIHPETGQSLHDIAQGFSPSLAAMRSRPDVSQALGPFADQS
jgi:2-amino-4-hydroxy-6-hydroxymethyldihydropteridine diphosphokinase